jgi:hypothetical protein
MLIHDNFVFLHLPKTAGSFIAAQLKREMPFRSLVRGVPGKPHPGWDEIPNEARGRPVLVYVRNPWDWYVSWHRAVLSNLSSRPSGAPAGLDDFGAAIRWACSRPTDSNVVWPPVRDGVSDFYTTRFLRICGGGLTSNELVFGRFETLIDDLDWFLTEAEAPLNGKAIATMRAAKPLNATERRPYPQYYDDELRDLVGQSCETIIERFGYRF